MIFRVFILFCLLALSTETFAQKTGNQTPNVERLITDLHKYQWDGAVNLTSSTHWIFRFTKPMQEILQIGNPAQKELLPYLRDDLIKDQIIILLGGVGNEQSVEPIINAMVSAEDIKTMPKAKELNDAANLALTNITVADVIWHHGGGISIEKCPDNPKECWSDWWNKNKMTFSVKDIRESRRYSNYPNYGIYKTK